MLENLTLTGVGPAKHITLNLSPRLNILTGDNGLGKTFVLDCACRALSGNWADPEMPVYPRSDSVSPAEVLLMHFHAFLKNSLLILTICFCSLEIQPIYLMMLEISLL